MSYYKSYYMETKSQYYTVSGRDVWSFMEDAQLDEETHAQHEGPAIWLFYKLVVLRMIGLYLALTKKQPHVAFYI